MTTSHVPVLIHPIVQFAEDRTVVNILDGTLGGGGHTLALAGLIPKNGILVCCDRDPHAVELFSNRLRDNQPPLDGKVLPLRCSYHEASHHLLDKGLGELRFDLILLDLGLSSDQLADDTRGFSFRSSGELDLRFNPAEGQPAWEVLQLADEKEIADILYKYGEERFSRRIAANIVRTRKQNPIRTAEQFRELIRSSVPRNKNDRIDPATRSFQALRIYVNSELEILSDALLTLPKLLSVGGHFLIISFHSLEDRLVKNAFRDARDLEVVTRKPIIPDNNEIEFNPRSRSAKLRIAKKLGPDELKPMAPLSDADFLRYRR